MRGKTRSTRSQVRAFFPSGLLATYDTAFVSGDPTSLANQPSLLRDRDAPIAYLDLMSALGRTTKLPALSEPCLRAQTIRARLSMEIIVATAKSSRQFHLPAMCAAPQRFAGAHAASPELHGGRRWPLRSASHTENVLCTILAMAEPR